jgi:hypothetical protein
VRNFAGLAALWSLVAAALLAAAPAVADSWAPAERKVYRSADRRLRLTVTPRDLSGPLDYFEDRVEDRARPGQRAGGATSARGLLERRQGKRRWTRLWDRQLVNDVAPMSALVAGDGRFVVTFDNWASLGTGGDVVVIYGAQGELVRSLGLTDILPETYVEALPRTVSSIWWSGDHALSMDGRRLVLRVVVPSERRTLNEPPFVEAEVDLASGRPIAPAGAAWKQALAAASRVAAARRAAEEARIAAFVAPLLAPASGREPDWHHYLREAFYRVDPDWAEGFPRTTVLRPPGADNYRQSVPWVRNALLDDLVREGDALMFASSAQDNLTKVLVEALRHVPPGGLRGVRVYVAVGGEYRDRLAEALAPTGALFVPLDPAVPIPQRPERLARARREAGE